MIGLAPGSSCAAGAAPPQHRATSDRRL